MIGPEHYRRAEELLATSASQQRNLGAVQRDLLIRRAAVHATLALAAATAIPVHELEGETGRQWRSMVLAPRDPQ